MRILDRKLSTIGNGAIHYKNAEIHEASVNVMGISSIVLNRITLRAVVRGNEVTHPFIVTEVYVKKVVAGNWLIFLL